jgi:hypothetical protein
MEGRESESESEKAPKYGPRKNERKESESESENAPKDGQKKNEDGKEKKKK